MRYFGYHASCVVVILATLAAHAENMQTARVVNESGVEAVSGIVLVLNPGRTADSRAYVTDKNGTANMPDVICSIYTLGAFDPRGRYRNAITEFAAGSTPVTIVLRAQPVIDIVRDPKSAPVDLVINGPESRLLVDEKVVIRSNQFGLAENWVMQVRTDLQGKLRVELSPGKYVAAMVRGRTVYEAAFEITKGRQRCGSHHTVCIESLGKGRSLRRPYRISLSKAGTQSSVDDCENRQVDLCHP